MIKRRMNQRGSGTVVGLVIALIVIIGGLVGTRVSQKNMKPAPPSAQEQAIIDAKNYRPEGNCTQAEVPAVHDKTGARYTFPTGCIAPGWSSTLSISPSDPSPVPSTSDKPAGFDIEAFYNNVQIGMIDNDVIKLAGRQPNDCASTGSIPPATSCFWYDGTKTVTVHYGQTSYVQSKSKSGF